MTQNYPWYELTTSHELHQGDLFFDCPVAIPAEDHRNEPVSLSVDLFEYDVIVLSQSCDLENRKLNLVTVCPHWPLSKLAERAPHFKTERGWRELVQGNLPGYHLINRSDLHSSMNEPRVVDFRNVYGLPFDFLTRFAKQQGERLRLLPPYREHLSQAFARFFMRVGLPVQVELEK